MSRRAWFLILLPALVLISTAPPPRAQEVQQEQQPPPAKRMRRVEGDQPKEPARTPDNQPPAAGEDDEVVRVDTELATVLLTAVDKDRRFVTTLRREDVRVIEDDVAQELSVFERETDLPLTLAILIDTSGSQERTLPDEKTAARAFIDSVLRPDRDRAAVISFTGEAVLEQDLTGDPGSLRAAVERVAVQFTKLSPECANATPMREPRCYTGVWDAAWTTVNEVLSQTPAQSRRAVILLTDGDDTSSMTKRQEAIDLAIQHNVVIYSIGIGDEEEYKISDDALRKISERTGGRAFFPESKQELVAAFAQIQQELRSQYLLAYRPSNTRRDGSFRQVRVEVVNPDLRKQKLRLLYRQGYYAKRSGPSANSNE